MADVRAVLVADFEGFARVLDKLLGDEIESFQRLSGLYNMKDDVDGVVNRMMALRDEIRVGLAGGAAVEPVAAQARLMDVLLEQLDRYVTVGHQRGAAETSGDLLSKLQGWIVILRDWLAGIGRQVAGIGA